MCDGRSGLSCSYATQAGAAVPWVRNVRRRGRRSPLSSGLRPSIAHSVLQVIAQHLRAMEGMFCCAPSQRQRARRSLGCAACAAAAAALHCPVGFNPQ